MSRTRTIGRRAVMAAAAALAAPAIVRAQAYPARTVRVVNAYSPGGTADVICRILCAGLTDKLGQSFAVDNPRDLRRWQEGDLVVITVNGDVVTDIRAGGLTGRIVDVDRRRGEVRIEADGRTQSYDVEDKNMLEDVRVGDKVRFEIAQRRGRQVITSIR